MVKSCGRRWIIKRALARLSKPVDRERWGSMDPTQVRERERER
jgi:predicted metalloendopeptidase